MPNKIIGIDLGTTNSCVSIVQNGQAKIIPNDIGQRTTPSVVGFLKNGQRVVGQIANRQAITNPKNTINSVKRLMGSQFNDVRDYVGKLPYKVKSNTKGQSVVLVQGQNKQYTPQQISAIILKKMKQSAQAYLGQEVTQAVITVPAYFNDDQRSATKDAGRIAGLQVLRIINEPTSAALSYGVQSKINKKVAVFDFGGGTYDVSILDIFDGVIEVLSTNGDTLLGGDDITNVVVNYIISQFKRTDGIDLSKDLMAMQRVRQSAQKAKIELSGTSTTTINLPYITADSNGPKHLEIPLTLSKFQALIQPIVKRTIEPCKNAISDSKISVKQIDQVLLVGGTTRIPMVQRIVKQIFGKQPNKSINPDQAVAIGAAIQGAILGGDSAVKDLLLLDVTPLSLGIETMGGVFTKVIDRNTTIPVKKSQIFSTASDNQTAVTIHVLQGQRPMSANNKSLGNFQLSGLAPAPKGTPQIQVSFDLDANGILSVVALDKATNKSQTIKIDRGGQLSQGDIQKMIKDAQLHSKQDQQKRQFIDSKNKLQGLIYTTQKTIAQYKDKVPETVIQQVTVQLQDSKQKLLSLTTKDQIDEQYTKLQTKLQEIGKHVYNEQQQEEQPQQQQEQKQEDPNIVDAQYQVL